MPLLEDGQQHVEDSSTRLGPKIVSAARRRCRGRKPVAVHARLGMVISPHTHSHNKCAPVPVVIAGHTRDTREFFRPAVRADDVRGLLRQFLIRGCPLRGVCEVEEAYASVGPRSGGEGQGPREHRVVTRAVLRYFGPGLSGMGLTWMRNTGEVAGFDNSVHTCRHV